MLHFILTNLKGSLYLDHAGSALAPKSLLDGFAAKLTSALYGNPHSASTSSQLTSSIIDDTRLRLLHFFGANSDDYDLVFVANATAGVKLVMEAMRAVPSGFRYSYHEACHTSLVGVREEASSSCCFTNEDAESWIAGKTAIQPESSSIDDTLLVSYSAQSHLDGQRYPLSWCQDLRNIPSGQKVYTLLDASSFVATSPLNLDQAAPDFTVLSFYKIFGFPDLGALIIRRDSAPIFNHRRYFGGGTVDMVVCGNEQWHARKPTVHEHLEDGTPPFHSIIAAGLALSVHTQLFGSMESVKLHTGWLTRKLSNGLRQLKHGNGSQVCTLYAHEESQTGGPVISFNMRDSRGSWVSLAEVEKLAMLRNIHLRTGSVCSPGGIASTLDLQPWEMRKNFSAGYRCGGDSDVLNGKPTGVVRVSLGAMSTMSDVREFLAFIEEFFVQLDVSVPNDSGYTPAKATLKLKEITVYPIKSCGGFSVPAGTPWAIKPEGLAWDREWCLVHRGTGQALNQKRYPKMALLRPYLDFDAGSLHVTRNDQDTISIPLSSNPVLFTTTANRPISRVCGDQICTQIYSCEKINSFFSDALGVPCALARYPAGGENSRISKLTIPRERGSRQRLPGSFPSDIPSPPDSDSEPLSTSIPETKLLLSNESPILMIHSASVDALNKDITSNGGNPVLSTAFRANLLFEGIDESSAAWAEDSWRQLNIGSSRFTLLGPCRRCQMVCVDQQTAERKQEPFVTLAKTRRVSGKVYFGMHMKHELNRDANVGQQFVTVGDEVTVME